MARKALCVGINDYPGTDSDLRCCVNDARDWAAFLLPRGWDVELLLDAQASRANILAGIGRTLDALDPGETGVITFAGHGTWVPDSDGDEADSRDEGLCPSDLVLGQTPLLDDELDAALADRCRGSYVVLVTDACHSGSVARFVGRPGYRSVRFLPPLHFLKAPAAGIALAAMRNTGPGRRRRTSPGVIHLAGCRDNEYCYEADLDGRSRGVFTAAALWALDQLPAGGTYADLIRLIRARLPSFDYPQTPQLGATATLRRLPAFV